jgi:hypothetical protein
MWDRLGLDFQGLRRHGSGSCLPAGGRADYRQLRHTRDASRFIWIRDCSERIHNASTSAKRWK